MSLYLHLYLYWTKLLIKSNPNCIVGQPDFNLLQILRQEKKLTDSISAINNLFVLQAIKDIQKGEMLTINKNNSRSLSPKKFEEWMGFKY